jgi:hypothetical protein
VDVPACGWVRLRSPARRVVIADWDIRSLAQCRVSPWPQHVREDARSHAVQQLRADQPRGVVQKGVEQRPNRQDDEAGDKDRLAAPGLHVPSDHEGDRQHHDLGRVAGQWDGNVSVRSGAPGNADLRSLPSVALAKEITGIV